jgi:hypothetical protein
VVSLDVSPPSLSLSRRCAVVAIHPVLARSYVVIYSIILGKSWASKHWKIYENLKQLGHFFVIQVCHFEFALSFYCHFGLGNMRKKVGVLGNGLKEVPDAVHLARW